MGQEKHKWSSISPTVGIGSLVDDPAHLNENCTEILRVRAHLERMRALGAGFDMGVLPGAELDAPFPIGPQAMQRHMPGESSQRITIGASVGSFSHG